MPGPLYKALELARLGPSHRCEQKAASEATTEQHRSAGRTKLQEDSRHRISSLLGCAKEEEYKDWFPHGSTHHSEIRHWEWTWGSEMGTEGKVLLSQGGASW